LISYADVVHGMTGKGGKTERKAERDKTGVERPPTTDYKEWRRYGDTKPYRPIRGQDSDATSGMKA